MAKDVSNVLNFSDSLNFLTKYIKLTPINHRQKLKEQAELLRTKRRKIGRLVVVRFTCKIIPVN